MIAIAYRKTPMTSIVYTYSNPYPASKINIVDNKTENSLY